MGYTNLKEPDFRNVAKKLVRVEKPCVAELSTLMDCMKVSLRNDQRMLHAVGRNVVRWIPCV